MRYCGTDLHFLNLCNSSNQFWILGQVGVAHHLHPAIANASYHHLEVGFSHEKNSKMTRNELVL